MSTSIKLNIERLLKEKGWKISDLERETATEKKHSIYNIMRGLSNNPSIELLQSIANAFNVEIKELIREPSQKTELVSRYDLFNQICQMVTKELKSQSLEVPLDKLFLLIKEVYLYSTKLEPVNIDEKFIN